jgi:cell division protein FtsB
LDIEKGKFKAKFGPELKEAQSRFECKIDELKIKFGNVKAENATIKREVIGLKSEKEALNKQIKKLQEKYDRLKTEKALPLVDEKKGVRNSGWPFKPNTRTNQALSRRGNQEFALQASCISFEE